MKTDLKRVAELIQFPLIKRDRRIVNGDNEKNEPKSELRSPYDLSFFSYVRKHSKILGIWTPLLAGIVFITLGIISTIWTPYQLMMSERVRMRPGLPPYEWWQVPPDEVYLKMHLFNLTNAQEFLDDTNVKLCVEEIGPIVFKEKLIHTNITFNENGTLSYIAKRSITFLPEMNKYNLNDTVVMPNIAILGMASYLWDTPFFTKFGFNLLMRTLKSQPVITRTIYEILWNLTDPILGAAQTIAPSLVPTRNMGYLTRMYDGSEDVVTVYLGPKYGNDEFFQIDKFGGSEYLPGYRPEECQDKLQNSSEGVAYPVLLNKDTVLHFWKKTICKVYALPFREEKSKYGINAYLYVLPNNSFDRTYPSYEDCYISDPPLPNGLTDVSKCHYDFPVAASFPHFLYAGDDLKNFVEGLNPDENLHGSYILAEPTVGVPLESRARSQSNLVIHKLSGFNEIVNRFSDMVIPMFWAEFHQVGLPWYIVAAVYCAVVLLPVGQVLMTIFFFIFGLYLIFISLRKFRARRKKIHIVRNSVMHFEQEVELEESDKPLLTIDD